MAVESTNFGRYQLLEKLGEGASASVYRGVRSGPMGFRKEVAIKQLRPHVAEGRKAIRALVNEARLGGFLRHANVVEVYEFDKVDDIYFIAMELVQGYALDKVIKRIPEQGAIPPRIVLQIAMQICKGLAYAHTAADDKDQPMNLVHRDLKPANVMLKRQGIVKIMDFGIARADTNLFLTQMEGTTKGTPSYMSPEQTVGDKDDPLDHRSDLFSLASLMAEMITGEVAFKGDKVYEILNKIAHAETTAVLHKAEQRLPELVPVLERAFQRRPEKRYGSADEMGRDIAQVYRELPGDEQLGPWLAEWMDGEEPSVSAAASSGSGEPVGMTTSWDRIVVDPSAFTDGESDEEYRRLAEEPEPDVKRERNLWPLVSLIAIPLLLLLIGGVITSIVVALESSLGGGDVEIAEGTPAPDEDALASPVGPVGEAEAVGSGEMTAAPAEEAPIPVASESPAIIFTTRPSGADVIMDNRKLGNTAYRFEQGLPGRAYAVTFSKSGYEDATGSDVFPEEGSRTVHVDLQRSATTEPPPSEGPVDEGELADGEDEDLPEASEAVSRASVEFILGSNAAVRNCFVAEQADGVELAGKIWVKFDVYPDGHVSGARIITEGYAGSSLETCVARQIATLEFPRFRGTKSRSAKYYYEF